MRIIHRNEEGAPTRGRTMQKTTIIYGILETHQMMFLRLTRAEGTSLHGAGS